MPGIRSRRRTRTASRRSPRCSGSRPAAVGRCRVLELGCGDAGNLAPMALALPEAEFVGIDAAPGAIARGRALADAIRLPNLTLEAIAIEDFEPDAGGFDYVIAHGVYSWLPAPARDRLLALCARALARGGVAYVSYNALPGGRVARGAARHAALPHRRVRGPGRADRAGPRAAALPARGLAARAGATPPGRAAARPGRRQPAPRRARGRQRSRLLPRVRRARRPLTGSSTSPKPTSSKCRSGSPRHPLRTRCERSTTSSGASSTSTSSRAACSARRCSATPASALERSARPSVIAELAVLHARGPFGRRPGATVFEGPTGSTLTTDHPLRDRRARAGRASLAGGRLGARPRGTDEALCGALLRAYGANLVQLHAHPPAIWRTRPGERPEASRARAPPGRAGASS